ncbi:MAG: AbrB/MazE/SpoVT family DNA-binding domain-containing protein [Vulcanisaeta sp.]|nr:AbrB/MazE/SpoVT family DNA-binding domain-containing protein [Vulcanisaeta sp.]
MPKQYTVTSLPYTAKVYINNQVLLPAGLVRALGIEGVRYADVVIRHGDAVAVLKCVKLLRTRHTSARQFTIPKGVRGKYGIKPLDEVVILSIKPAGLGP